MTSHVLGYTILFMLWGCCPAQDENGCGPPPRTDNEELADLSGKSSYSHNDIVSYNCRPGFIKLGRIRFKCNQGTWEQLPPLTQCKRRPCGNPGDIEFGSFELVQGNEFVFGARVEYRCDPGYQMLSQTNYRVCQANGWSNDVPHCEVKKCFPVKAPENGRIVMTGIHNVDQAFVFGQALQFECNAKFRIQGAKQIVCGDEGQWNPPVPTCEEIICIPGDIIYGIITSAKLVYKDGDELRFDCRSGYKPIDRSVAICSENGWNTRLQCTEIVCSPPVVNDGRVNPAKAQYSYEETIQIQCDSGYKPERGATSTCTKTGWLPQPRCVSKLCDYPEEGNLEVHNYPWENRYRYFPKREGDYISVRCINGFLSASKERGWYYSKCTKFGWDPEPKCFQQCDPSSRFPHGRFHYRYKEKFIEGNEISFSCDKEYFHEPQGGKSKCTKNGWSPVPRCIYGEIPTCRRDPPLNGYFIEEKDWSALNEKTRYRCHAGFTTQQGEEEGETQCLQEGWTPKPECVKTFTCQRDPPKDGFFTDPKEQFALRERTGYRCVIGFTTRQGGEEGETQCLPEGWTPKPECVKTCQKPTEGNVIISITKSTFVLEENLPFMCEEGYETIKKTLEDHSNCTANGWNPKPLCLPIKCEDPILENMDIQPRNDQYLYRDVVRFNCLQGLVRVGPPSAQCYHFGWSPPPPTCKAPGEVRPCQPPRNITNGRMITALQEEYPHGQQAEYECNLKYAMTGSKKVECVDGKWTSLPSCTAEKRTCGRPPRIANGHPVRTDQSRYVHGETVRYECDEGIAIVGTNPAKCLHGKWNLPSCADGCAPPKIPKNTNSDPLRDHYNNNEVVSYRCGSSQHATKCVRGNWSPDPLCRDLCPPPPQLPNAIEIIEVRNYENAETVRFTCKEHFLLEGSEEIACEDGKWKTPPHCVDARCGNPPPIANGSLVNGTLGKYSPGTKVDYHCNEGFEISRIKSSTCKNRVWTQTPTCKDARCGNPPPIVGGSAVNGTLGKYLPGMKVEYQCNEGFDIGRVRSSTCRNRSWSQAPTCKEKPCGPPPQVFDASRDGRDKKSYLPGEEVHYICHPGFHSDGPLNVTCRKGQWTKTPTCEDASCEEPPRISNADIIWGRRNVYKPGQRVQYRCHEGFEISEPDYVTCGVRVWSEPPTCQDVRCLPPAQIAHGELVGQPKEIYMPFETAKFQCNRGWILSGPVVVTCLKRQWSNLPKCTDPNAKCGRPPPIQNGDVITLVQAQYELGARLQYQCQNFYVMNGTSEIRCEDGHWTEAPTCIEACTITSEDMRQNNIRLKWRRGPKLYSESGDEMEFECIWNYRKDPSSPPMRTRCIEGTVEYPRCIPNW